MGEADGHISLNLGAHGDYLWLVSEGHGLDDLLRLAPELFLRRYVALTSIDSGSLVPTEEEKAAGWESRGGLGYSPAISDLEALPWAGWDEWFIFNERVDLGELWVGPNIFENPPTAGKVHAFVNFYLQLHLPEHGPLVDMFWEQLDRLRPWAYVAQTDYFLTFVCVDHTQFEAVRAALSRSGCADLP